MNIMLELTDHPPVPENVEEAAACLRHVLRMRKELPKIEHDAFISAWSSLTYLMPGLHPDESGHDDGGWPVGWRCIAAEAFRRSEAGEMNDSVLYPYESSLHSLKINGGQISPQR